MFEAEKLLGQVMSDALSGALGGQRRRRSSSPFAGGRGLGLGSQAKLGMGLLALAYAAYEHFSEKSTASGTVAKGPPPPPGAAAAIPPPPPPAADHERALHLLRAMVCAANADGLVDAEEREALLGRARDAGMKEAEVAALEVEIRSPLTLQQLVARTPPELRDEVYAAAMIAITPDTDREHRFLEELASKLGLDASAQQEIKQKIA